LPIRVTRLVPPTDVAWDCPGAFPVLGGTDVAWSLAPTEHGTKVVFRHAGFSEEQPLCDFGTISLTWATTLARLNEVVESGGEPNPALS